MTDYPAGDYIELTVPVDGEAAEAVCALFERYGGGAVVEILLTDGPDDARGRATPTTNVRTYIPAHDVAARAKLEEGLWHLGRLHPIPAASIRRLAEANWAEAWKAHYTPQRIGRRFLVVPSWLRPEPRPGERVIRLDPGMAFGTGLHPTTRLCLCALEDVVHPGGSVLDVGTGSGILAIAARLLGAARVVALDISPDAVAQACQNAHLNGVSIAPFTGTARALPPERFDVLVANLLAVTVTELAGALRARTGPTGTLVASGMLVDQAADVAAALRAAGFAVVHRRTSGDWAALMCSAPGQPAGDRP